MSNRSINVGDSVRVRGFNMVGQIYPEAVGTVLRIEKYSVQGHSSVFDSLTVVNAKTENEIFITVELPNGEHRFDRLAEVKPA